MSWQCYKNLVPIFFVEYHKFMYDGYESKSDPAYNLFKCILKSEPLF